MISSTTYKPTTPFSDQLGMASIDPDDAQIPDNQDGDLTEEDDEDDEEDKEKPTGSSRQPIGRRNGFHRPVV